jgi:hypothetical protein
LVAHDGRADARWPTDREGHDEPARDASAGKFRRDTAPSIFDTACAGYCESARLRLRLAPSSL